MIDFMDNIGWAIVLSAWLVVLLRLASGTALAISFSALALTSLTSCAAYLVGYFDYIGVVALNGLVYALCALAAMHANRAGLSVALTIGTIAYFATYNLATVGVYLEAGYYALFIPVELLVVCASVGVSNGGRPAPINRIWRNLGASIFLDRGVRA